MSVTAVTSARGLLKLRIKTTNLQVVHISWAPEDPTTPQKSIRPHLWRLGGPIPSAWVVGPCIRNSQLHSTCVWQNFGSFYAVLLFCTVRSWPEKMRNKLQQRVLNFKFNARFPWTRTLHDSIYWCHLPFESKKNWQNIAIDPWDITARY